MAPSAVLALPDNFKWAALSSGAIALECFFLGFIYINQARGKTFPKEFMDREFGEISNKELGEPTKRGGYPDSGNGVHSDKLEFFEWFKFNSSMRGHLNFVENLPLIVILILIAGCYFPIAGAILGLLLFISRLLYILGYIANPKLRFFGFIPQMACIMTLIILVAVGVGKQLAK